MIHGNSRNISSDSASNGEKWWERFGGVALGKLAQHSPPMVRDTFPIIRRCWTRIGCCLFIRVARKLGVLPQSLPQRELFFIILQNFFSLILQRDAMNTLLLVQRTQESENLEGNKAIDQREHYLHCVALYGRAAGTIFTLLKLGQSCVQFAGASAATGPRDGCLVP